MSKMPNHHINKTMICSLSLSLSQDHLILVLFLKKFKWANSYFYPFFLGMMIRKHINKIATKLHGVPDMLMGYYT